MLAMLALGATLAAPNFNPEMKVDDEVLQARTTTSNDQSQEQPLAPEGLNKLKVDAGTRAPGAKLVGYCEHAG